MADLLQDPKAQAVLWSAVAIAMLVFLFYLVGKLRGGADDDQPVSGELLSKFREMHARGVLSDAEYRTIKTKLLAQLGEELKETDEPS